jgi:hypothetical protein
MRGYGNSRSRTEISSKVEITNYKLAFEIIIEAPLWRNGWCFIV